MLSKQGRVNIIFVTLTVSMFLQSTGPEKATLYLYEESFREVVISGSGNFKNGFFLLCSLLIVILNRQLNGSQEWLFQVSFKLVILSETNQKFTILFNFIH